MIQIANNDAICSNIDKIDGKQNYCFVLMDFYVVFFSIIFRETQNVSVYDVISYKTHLRLRFNNGAAAVLFRFFM